MHLRHAEETIQRCKQQAQPREAELSRRLFQPIVRLGKREPFSLPGTGPSGPRPAAEARSGPASHFGLRAPQIETHNLTQAARRQSHLPIAGCCLPASLTVWLKWVRLSRRPRDGETVCRKILGPETIMQHLTLASARRARSDSLPAAGGTGATRS